MKDCGCTPLVDEEKNVKGWICRGANQRYWAGARREGHRKWEPIGKPTRSYRVAVRRMADAFTTGHYKRAHVLMSADYYDAIQLCELVRR